MTRSARFSSLFAATFFFLAGAPALAQDSAQDIDCGECHAAADVGYTSTAPPDVACIECHTNVTPAHKDADLEPLTDEESCGECHGSILRSAGRSVHKGEAGCNDCHGAPHAIHEVDDLASAVSPINQIQQCGACHDDPPELVDGYLTSEHGKALLLAGLVNAPSCSDCHGDHRIMTADSSRAPTEHYNSPEMCGTCHQILFEEWKEQSAHGLAWQDEKEGPVCVDCHSSHQVRDPSTYDARHAGAQNCGGCHEEYLNTFQFSFHGQALHLGLSEGATCADCHTPHKNLAADNPALLQGYAQTLDDIYADYQRVARRFAIVIGHPAIIRRLTHLGMRSRPLMEWALKVMANLLEPEEKGLSERIYGTIERIVRITPDPLLK